MATSALHFNVTVPRYGLPWFVRSISAKGVQMVQSRKKAKQFGKLDGEDVAKKLKDAVLVREDEPVPVVPPAQGGCELPQKPIEEKEVMTKAKKSTKTSTANKAVATTNPKPEVKAEPDQPVLGKTRELILRGMKDGRFLKVTFKGNAMQEAALGDEKVRVVGFKQLAGLKFIEPTGERKEGVQQYKLTDAGKGYAFAGEKKAA